MQRKFAFFILNAREAGVFASEFHLSSTSVCRLGNDGTTFRIERLICGAEVRIFFDKIAFNNIVHDSTDILSTGYFRCPRKRRFLSKSITLSFSLCNIYVDKMSPVFSSLETTALNLA